MVEHHGYLKLFRETMHRFWKKELLFFTVQNSSYDCVTYHPFVAGK
jgi:hypothetical protein